MPVHITVYRELVEQVVHLHFTTFTATSRCVLTILNSTKMEFENNKVDLPLFPGLSIVFIDPSLGVTRLFLLLLSCCVSPASISRYDLASLTVQNEKTRVAFLVEWVGTLRALEEYRSIPPWLETGLMNEIAGRRFNLIEKMNETIEGEKSKKNEKSSRDDLIFDRVTTKLANPSCISCLQIILLFINIILHKYYIFQDYLILKTSKLE